MRRILMSRPCLAILLTLVEASAFATPATAFWERSQWSRCSDAATAAEWSRYRCWQLDPYHDGSGHPGYGGGLGSHYGGRDPNDRTRRGGVVVKRLG